MRVLIWATHLQTDILALASYLDRCPDVDLLVVTPHPEAFLSEPYARARPLAAPLLDRNARGTEARVRAFGADVAVADNHVPPKGSAPRLFYMWHGLGWKARSRLDLKVFYHQVRQLTGLDPRVPNPRFLAQCYGPTDLDWRVKNWKLPASACAAVGMAFSDLLFDPPYAKRDIAGRFGIDVLKRRTVALVITWHYGGIFASPPKARWFEPRNVARSDDRAFVQSMADAVGARGANLLICLHDRQRYDRALLAELEALAAANDFVELRFKNEHPDNLVDLLVADVMVSNLSSFLAYHYLRRRPAVHLLPADVGVAEVERTTMLFSRIRVRRRVRSEEAWMLNPRNTAGPIATDAGEAVAAVEAALDDPGSGFAATGTWLARQLPVIDGGAAARCKRCLEDLCAR